MVYSSKDGAEKARRSQDMPKNLEFGAAEVVLQELGHKKCHPDVSFLHAENSFIEMETESF